MVKGDEEDGEEEEEEVCFLVDGEEEEEEEEEGGFDGRFVTDLDGPSSMADPNAMNSLDDSSMKA